MSGNVTKGVVLFLCGGVLGWFLQANWPSKAPLEIAQHTDDAPMQRNAAENKPAATQTSSTGMAHLARLLREEHYDDVVQQYLDLADNTNQTTVQLYRNMILQHARDLIDNHQYQPAAELLSLYTDNEFRDVEARELLADVYGLQNDYLSQINTPGR